NGLEPPANLGEKLVEGLFARLAHGGRSSEPRTRPPRLRLPAKLVLDCSKRLFLENPRLGLRRSVDAGHLRACLRVEPRLFGGRFRFQSRQEIRERHRPAQRSTMIIAATANPRMIIVSGIATIRIARPVSSGFSAIAAIAAAPMRACAKPVPIAPRPTASPAPSAISPCCIMGFSLGSVTITVLRVRRTVGTVFR